MTLTTGLCRSNATRPTQRYPVIGVHTRVCHVLLPGPVPGNRTRFHRLGITPTTTYTGRLPRHTSLIFVTCRVDDNETKHHPFDRLQHRRRLKDELADRHRSDTSAASSSSQATFLSHLDNSENRPSIHTPPMPSVFPGHPSHHYAASRSSGDTARVAFCQIYFSGHHFGKINPLNGMPILSEEGRGWISSRTGEQVPLDNFRAIAMHHLWSTTPVTHGASPSSSLEEVFRLPDSAVVYEALEMFRGSPYRVVFPLVDPVLFPRIIALAYERPEARFSLEGITAKCCVFAFLSIAYIFWNPAVEVPRMDSDAFAMKAYRLLPDVVEDTSIVGLQAISMLVSLTESCRDPTPGLLFYSVHG